MSYAKYCRLMAEASELNATAFELELKADLVWPGPGDRSTQRAHLVDMRAAALSLAASYRKSAEESERAADLSQRLRDSLYADSYEAEARACEAIGNKRRAATLRRTAKRLRSVPAP